MGASEMQGEATQFRDPEPFEFDAAGQHLAFYPAGADRRAALFDLVESAKEKLDVCFYIFAEDTVSTEFRDALVVAAKRGVDVTLIVDRFGADASDLFLRPLIDAGGTFLVFSAKWTRRYLIRNHQKLVVADGKRAMFGGFNIADDYFAPPEENGWNDLGIVIEGSAVEGLNDWYAKLRSWTEREEQHAREIARTVRDWEWKEPNATWLVGGPTRGLSSWARCVSDDLVEGERLDMFMAYFSPPKKLLKHMGRIAQKGETRLVMAGKSDNGATIGASRSLYDFLLSKRAKIWEFVPCKLHTKLIVLDDSVYIGSANFDMRSLYINLELVLKIDDAALADRMRQFVSDHIAASQQVTIPLHKKRATLWNRIRWNLSWLLVSVVDYTVTRRLNLGI
ncbi:phospholipase D-like domain-containing protein [Qipengyuania nanhaisediminis]|nr:phosphatidylserine/phosphatidylglycerophosphate/cardiolipin synthase family protein [Qipengyuania nanhaisediminis]